MNGRIACRVGVVDVGIANLGSVLRVLTDLVDTVVPLTDPAQFAAVDRIILPGVGAFPEAMRRLRNSGIDQSLTESVVNLGKPLLGICLGMQLMCSIGEEHEQTEGLGLIPGRVRRLDGAPGLRVPHMGWNSLDVRQASPLLSGIPNRQDVYFVHSYVFDPLDSADVVATTHHGSDFCSVIERRNVIGVQFHPEKSSNTGRAILRNFCEMPPC